MNAFLPADILLPKTNHMEKWAVIACDQFTSDQGYWDRVRKNAEGAVSTINLILPEAELGTEKEAAHTAEINATMKKYVDEGVFTVYPNSYNNENVEHYDYNPEKAKSILESIGCTMGESGYYERNGAEIGFVISVMAGEQDRIDIAQAAAQQLREVGIHCTVDIPAKMDWGGQQACLIGWGSPFDADDHTYKVFGTDKGANYSGYSNEKVDEYLTKARESSDPAVRKEYYDLFQIELANDPAYAFICYIDANYVASARLHGISTDTVMGHHGVGIFWNVCEWTLD